MRTSKLLATSAVAATGLLFVTPSLASAGPKPPPAPVVRSTAVAAPFNLALNHGKVFVADGGLNLVGKLKNDGTIKTLAADQPGASGIATSRNGRVLAFTTTVTDPKTMENSASGLHIWGAKGKRIFADTFAYETAHNPDKINSYGPRSTDPCVIAAVGPRYQGQVDAHSYSVTAYGDQWIVADAGANALWKIDQRGRIRTLAVLPPQPATLPVPGCAGNVTYDFEPVPTDVEVGKDGYLYVTTLPGGPEDPSAGARGKLWRVNPRTGGAKVIASGFAGATNLAIGKRGEIYVAELFGGKISIVRHGKKSDYLTLPGVVAVETTKGGELWAATLGNEDPPAPGTIVKITHGKASKQGTVKP
jgi:hypothetical protein